ncbi:MAG: Dna2/Cas4 domain-containing protein, partial [Candidatus Moranbacteria bacterium]|nr:Dna2/Cas4 domain-containing protein [Candidatus Moranbacteria bacterium]
IKEEKIKILEKKLLKEKAGVKVLTAHNAKGREFETVFITRLYRGNWDGRRNNEKIKFPKELYLDFSKREFKILNDEKKQKEEDERRVFFVAMTRAKENLFLSFADRYEIKGQEREYQPSKFVQELSENLAVSQKTDQYEKFGDIIKAKLLGKTKKELNSLNSISLLDSASENEIIEEKIKNLSLSPTSLNLYLNCPRKFKYEKLLMAPRLKDKSSSLGTAVHEALELFMLDYKKGQGLDKNKLIQYFKQALDKEILTKNDYNFVLLEGQRILKRYFEFYKNSFKKPIALEKEFKVFFQSDVQLTGKIDKIELLNAKNQVKVIDYKTKKPATRNEIKGLTQNSTPDMFRQLVFYKLLSKKDKSFEYKVEEAEIDFIKDNDKGNFVKRSFKIKQKDIEELVSLIKQVIKNIKNKKFDQTAEDYRCENCDYLEICKN